MNTCPSCDTPLAHDHYPILCKCGTVIDNAEDDIGTPPLRRARGLGDIVASVQYRQANFVECPHRGEVEVGSIPCATCSGRIDMPIFRCGRHDEDVIPRRHRPPAGVEAWQGRNCIDCIADGEDGRAKE